MQEHRHDGTDELTPNATMQDVKRALKDPRNTAVTLHKPGSTVTMSDGKRYLVWKDGSLRRIES